MRQSVPFLVLASSIAIACGSSAAGDDELLGGEAPTNPPIVPCEPGCGPNDPSSDIGSSGGNSTTTPNDDELVGGVGKCTLTGTPLLDLMPAARLADIRKRLPVVNDKALSEILCSASTIWYDRTTIIPGYQDSFGDNVVAPIGFRPNTIDKGLINLAVPGGHEDLFVTKGFFHFPFGVTGGADDAPNATVVDFWSVPLDAQGKPLPVTWWRRDPNGYTHKYVWAFPKGTVLGEVLLLTAEDGEQYVYEIRTRRRELDGWKVDAFRPFPRAIDLATALTKMSAQNVAALQAHLANTQTVQPASLSASHFASAFPAQQAGKDVLPSIDPALAKKLLTETVFTSAKGLAWKSNGSVTAWAPTTNDSFSIVPKNYKGGFLEVSDASCSRCHADAGRPFKDWYPDVLAYGELWGEDEIFSWHPFETSKFVNAQGAVVNFNYDNRVIRQDFVQKGLVAKWEAAKHPASVYKEIPRAWRSFVY